MTTWNPRANELFLKALELRSAGERQEYLDGACAGDTALRAEVESLLEASDRAGNFLESPAPALHLVATVDELPSAERPGTVIGPYKLLQQIGEGGMGTVFMAEQTKPVQRRVALKIIKPGMDSTRVVARFEAERQALALMDHPNIAKVLDAGTTSGEPGGVSPGKPYFVMELVKGVPITKHCDERHLTPRERLELFVPVCQAVQHAHQKGIIHRDLKPSNVLIALYDGKAVPKVIDFGVAKATGTKLTERTLFTEFGQVVGTLEYMSPEQAELNNLDIDTRSDVYALGVLLYELLTGTTPLEKKRLKEAALLEVLRLIREEEPPKPSTRLSTTEELPSIAANRGLEPQKLSGLVKGELDWIVMKCLEKDRNRRYETANGLARDIERYLHDEPVQAAPPSPEYRFRKFTRRNKVALAVTGLTGVAMLAMAGLVIAQMINAELRSAYQAAEWQRGRAEAQEALARRYLYGAQINLANRAWEENQVDIMHALLEGQRPAAPADADLRGFEWHYLWRLSHQHQRTLRGHTDRVIHLARSPDGRRFASASDDGTAKVWDATTGKELFTLRGHRDKVVVICYSPDGRRLATGSHDSTIKIWDATTGKELRTLGGNVGFIRALAYSSDGCWLAAGSWADKAKDARLWDAQTFQEVRRLDGTGRYVRGVAFSPDGRQLATASHEGIVKLWEVPSGKVIRTLVQGRGPVFSVAYSPDGTRLATGHADGRVCLWDPATGRETVLLPRHARVVYHINFSRDGKFLASASWDQTAGVWDLATGDLVHTLKGHAGFVYCSCFSDDGTELLTGSGDHTIRVWNLKTRPATATIPWEATSVAFSPDGESLACAVGQEVRTWDMKDSKTTLSLVGHEVQVLSAIYSSEGHKLASRDRDGVIKIWDVRTGRETASFVGPRHRWPDFPLIHSLCFSPDAKRLAVAGDGLVQVRDVWSGKVLLTLPGDESVTFSPNGRYVASVGPECSIKVWDSQSGQEVASFPGHPNARWVMSVNFSPDGKRIVSAAFDNLVKVWDLESGRQVFTLSGHTCRVFSAVFSPDGRRIASASGDVNSPATAGEVILWDVQSGQEMVRLREQKGQTYCPAFSPDGYRLAAASSDGTVKIWDATPLVSER